MRYYWLKLNENFFDREEIKVIENMPKGKDYIIYYLKLLLKSVPTEGMLLFRNIIPYTPEMLASITNTDVDTVRVATDMFLNLGLMEKLDNGALFMNETQNMIGSENDSARRMRKLRENSKKLQLTPSQCDADVTMSDGDVQKSDIDIEIDIDKDISIHILAFWNSLEIVKHRELTEDLQQTIAKSLKTHSKEEIIQAIRNYHMILTSDDYLWDYTWTLKEFLRKGLEKFLDWETCSKNHLKKNWGKKREEEKPENYKGTDFTAFREN